MYKYVAVSATALDQSGALTILKQFLRYASEDTSNRYICFIPEGLNLEKPENMTLVEVPKMGWMNRIIWDCFKFSNEIRKRDVKPIKVISLQNTSVNTSVDQIIYLHQSLPFSSVKWSLFKKEHFKLFLYKHFYSFFIFLFIKHSTQFVVQTNWMKTALLKKSRVKEDNIHVIEPDIILPDVKLANYKVQKAGYYKLLYPATPFLYKNHELILKALALLKSEGKIEGIQFQVTFNVGEYPHFDSVLHKLALLDHVEYLGVIPHHELIEKYISATLVLFPSYVETFGLPLAEGASLKKIVLCSDLPFSRDVLEGYSGAIFLDFKDPRAWANAIKESINNIENNSLICGDFIMNKSSSWKDFFKLI